MKNQVKNLRVFFFLEVGGGRIFLFTPFHQWALVVSLAGLGWVPNKVPSQSSLSQFLEALGKPAAVQSWYTPSHGLLQIITTSSSPFTVISWILPTNRCILPSISCLPIFVAYNYKVHVTFATERPQDTHTMMFHQLCPTAQPLLPAQRCLWSTADALLVNHPAAASPWTSSVRKFCSFSGSPFTKIRALMWQMRNSLFVFVLDSSQCEHLPSQKWPIKGSAIPGNYYHSL